MEQPDADFQKLRDVVVDAAPTEFQSSLRLKMGVANELSLPARLHALVRPDRAALKAIGGDVAKGENSFRALRDW